MSLLGKEWYGEFIAHKDGFKEGVEEGFKVGYETAKKELQERKTGKWIRVDRNTFKCSECGNFLNFRGVNAGRGDANYCPNCGDKMEADE